MVTLMGIIVLLAVIFWGISELLSAIAGVFFIVLAAIILLKLAKSILK